MSQNEIDTINNLYNNDYHDGDISNADEGPGDRNDREKDGIHNAIEEFNVTPNIISTCLSDNSMNNCNDNGECESEAGDSPTDDMKNVEAQDVEKIIGSLNAENRDDMIDSYQKNHDTIDGKTLPYLKQNDCDNELQILTISAIGNPSIAALNNNDKSNEISEKCTYSCPTEISTNQSFESAECGNDETTIPENVETPDEIHKTMNSEQPIELDNSHDGILSNDNSEHSTCSETTEDQEKCTETEGTNVKRPNDDAMESISNNEDIIKPTTGINNQAKGRGRQGVDNELIIKQNGVFRCKICEKKYTLQANLIRHIREIHEKKTRIRKTSEYVCKICQATYKYRHHLSRHTEMHKMHDNNMAFKCDICDKTFLSKDYLRKHMKCRHLGFKRKKQVRVKKECPCPNCGRIFMRKDVMLKHMGRNACTKRYGKGQYSLPNSQQIQSFLCKVCKVEFHEGTDLYIHVNTTHLESKYKMELEKDLLQCPYCDKKFSLNVTMGEHYKAAHIGIMYQCLLCKKTWPYRSSSRRHFLKEHNQAFEKLLVRQIYNPKLKKDLEKIIPDKRIRVRKHPKYKCKFCPKILHRKDSYEMHLKMHEVKMKNKPETSFEDSHKTFLIDPEDCIFGEHQENQYPKRTKLESSSEESENDSQFEYDSEMSDNDNENTSDEDDNELYQNKTTLRHRKNKDGKEMSVSERHKHYNQDTTKTKRSLRLHKPGTKKGKRTTKHDKNETQKGKRTTEHDKNESLKDKRTTKHDKSETKKGKRTTEHDKNETVKDKRTTEHDKNETKKGKRTTEHDKNETEKDKRMTKHHENETVKDKRMTKHHENETKKGKRTTQHDKSETEKDKRSTKHDKARTEKNKTRKQDKTRTEKDKTSISKHHQHETGMDKAASTHHNHCNNKDETSSLCSIHQNVLQGKHKETYNTVWGSSSDEDISDDGLHNEEAYDDYDQYNNSELNHKRKPSQRLIPKQEPEFVESINSNTKGTSQIFQKQLKVRVKRFNVSKIEDSMNYKSIPKPLSKAFPKQLKVHVQRLDLNQIKDAMAKGKKKKIRNITQKDSHKSQPNKFSDDHTNGHNDDDADEHNHDNTSEHNPDNTSESNHNSTSEHNHDNTNGHNADHTNRNNDTWHDKHQDDNVAEERQHKETYNTVWGSSSDDDSSFDNNEQLGDQQNFNSHVSYNQTRNDSQPNHSGFIHRNFFDQLEYDLSRVKSEPVDM